MVLILFSEADDCQACFDHKNCVTNDSIKINATTNNRYSMKESIHEIIIHNQFFGNNENHSERRKHIPSFHIASKLTDNVHYVHGPVMMGAFSRLREPLDLVIIPSSFLSIRSIKFD